jgi:hypothetical protein
MIRCAGCENGVIGEPLRHRQTNEAADIRRPLIDHLVARASRVDGTSMASVLAVCGLSEERPLPDNCRHRSDVLVKPFGYHLGDGIAVLLHHHHMSVAVKADIGQLHERDVHPCLLQVTYSAMAIGRVKGCLGGEIENRPSPTATSLRAGSTCRQHFTRSGASAFSCCTNRSGDSGVTAGV